MYIDSHAHLTSDELYFQSDEIVKRAQSLKITKIINICTDIKTLERGLHLSKRYPWIVNAGSTTPHDVEKLGKKEFLAFQKAAEDGSLVSIGETGLDYYYEHSPKELQKKFLVRYLELAKKHQLPVIIHCREAFSDLFEICDKHYPVGNLILHCFTGTKEEAEEVIKRGWFLSLSGIVTFKKSQWLQEIAKHLPIDQVLIETDAPYLAPGRKRGKRNEPSFILETYQFVAQLRGINPEDLGTQMEHNLEVFLANKK